MKAAVVILVLATISACHARALQHDEPKTGWEETVDRFWQYVADLNTKADGVMQDIKDSQLRREMDTLITDTMDELVIYRDDIQSKLAPFARETSEKVRDDLQLLINKLYTDMSDARDRSTQYVNEMKTMMEQNADDIMNRVSAYTRKLKKRLHKDSEEIRNTATIYLEELQARASQNMESVKERLEPYVNQAHEKATERLGSLSELFKTQTQDLTEKFESQASAIRERLEQTAQDLRLTLEGQLEELTNWFTPYAAKIREQLKTVSDKIQA
ncbi:apolipoprotein Eb [Anguilla rostrata]|uniref:apolipoprotein Eb n=1 Tax=Anguilla rostrata TaxID=7938 RepID=UPI0030CA8928